MLNAARPGVDWYRRVWLLRSMATLDARLMTASRFGMNIKSGDLHFGRVVRVPIDFRYAAEMMTSTPGYGRNQSSRRGHGLLQRRDGHLASALATHRLYSHEPTRWAS